MLFDCGRPSYPNTPLGWLVEAFITVVLSVSCEVPSALPGMIEAFEPVEATADAAEYGSGGCGVVTYS